MSRRLRVLESIDQLVRARRPIDPACLAPAAAILADIEARGEPAARAHAERLGDIGSQSPIVHDRRALEAAVDRLSEHDRRALERAAASIRRFADAQRGCVRDLDTSIPGGRAGHRIVPVASAGCYGPGGRYPLPSSLLMTVATARAAGVERVWAASPRPADVMLAAAAIAGADALLAIGGVQAIASLVFGLFGAPPCDVVAGPGNRWVTAAKWLVSDRVGIDMLAGPSELVILADESADERVVAADLLAQAEHDDDAVVVLVTTDPSLPVRVEAELSRALETLPTSMTAEVALRSSCVLIVPSMTEGLEACERFAPEHLEVMTREADRVAASVNRAGTIFVGAASAEVFGDYGAGPNHVLPTGGTARFKSGLSVMTFLRAMTWLRVEPGVDLAALVRATGALARIEGLEGHARAAETRTRACRGDD